MRPRFRFIIKFGLALILMMVIGTVVWGEFVTDRLYNCTDGVPLDFLQPGNWVHAWGGHAIEVVPQIQPSPYMGGADTIKEGWSVGRLWALWWTMMAVVLGVSVGLAWLPWLPDWRGNEKRAGEGG